MTAALAAVVLSASPASMVSLVERMDVPAPGCDATTSSLISMVITDPLPAVFTFAYTADTVKAARTTCVAAFVPVTISPPTVVG